MANLDSNTRTLVDVLCRSFARVEACVDSRSGSIHNAAFVDALMAYGALISRHPRARRIRELARGRHTAMLAHWSELVASEHSARRDLFEAAREALPHDRHHGLNQVAERALNMFEDVGPAQVSYALSGFLVNGVAVYNTQAVSPARFEWEHHRRELYHFEKREVQGHVRRTPALGAHLLWVYAEEPLEATPVGETILRQIEAPDVEDRWRWRWAQSSLEVFTRVAVFHDWLLEQLLTEQQAHVLLQRFCRRAARFEGGRWRAVAESPGRRSNEDEAALQRELAMYLFDAGQEVAVEVELGDRRADVQSLESFTQDPPEGGCVVVELKVVRPGDDPSTIRSRLRTGAEQALQYAARVGQEEAHLVVLWHHGSRLNHQVEHPGETAKLTLHWIDVFPHRSREDEQVDVPIRHLRMWPYR